MKKILSICVAMLFVASLSITAVGCKKVEEPAPAEAPKVEAPVAPAPAPEGAPVAPAPETPPEPAAAK